MKVDLWPTGDEQGWDDVFADRREPDVAMEKWAAGLQARGVEVKYRPLTAEARRRGARELAVLHVPDDVAFDQQSEWIAANRPPAEWHGLLITSVHE